MVDAVSQPEATDGVSGVGSDVGLRMPAWLQAVSTATHAAEGAAPCSVIQLRADCPAGRADVDLAFRRAGGFLERSIRGYRDAWHRSSHPRERRSQSPQTTSQSALPGHCQVGRHSSSPSLFLSPGCLSSAAVSPPSPSPAGIPRPLLVVGVVLLVVGAAISRGVLSISPGEAVFLRLGGSYIGTARRAGLKWVHPTSRRTRVSTRIIRNHETGMLQVNDADGNPIEIAAAPEIAQPMLRVQQANAVVAARHRIVEGAAVGIVDACPRSPLGGRRGRARQGARGGDGRQSPCRPLQRPDPQPVVNSGTLY